MAGSPQVQVGIVQITRPTRLLPSKFDYHQTETALFRRFSYLSELEKMMWVVLAHEASNLRVALQEIMRRLQVLGG